MKRGWHVIAFSFLGIYAAACAQDGIIDLDPITFHSAGIIGPVWQWEGTLSNDGKKVVPADQKNYTVQLSKDGTLAIKADCNAKGGSFSIAEGKLSITITHSTLAACPEGSLEDQFVHDLTGAARVRNSDARSLDLHYDLWMMKFSRQMGPT